MKRFLIDDLRHSWRFLSLWASAGLAILSLAQTDVLPFLQFAIPTQYWPWVTFGFALAIAIFRVIKQGIPFDSMPANPGDSE